ncbi:MAG: hypothetical protein ACN6RH_12315 [Stenotrophomonas rhizophila]|uniref:hypothetical protein n=1 Tax=Stenotrophomonas rhizophila TaxID=216778 RepID=UPI003D0DA79A
MIALKKRNISVLTEDELTLVSGGSDTTDDRTDPWTPTIDDCTDPGYSMTPDCFQFPDTDGCPPDYTDADCP